MIHNIHLSPLTTVQNYQHQAPLCPYLQSKGRALAIFDGIVSDHALGLVFIAMADDLPRSGGSGVHVQRGHGARDCA